jgi:phage baseplate assembly protein W
MATNATYKDIDMNFTTHPITGDVLVKTDVAAVLQSIRNLIMTSAGEILWEPNIGGGVSKLLFELNDGLLQMMLHEKIINTINRFEPRVEIDSLDIQTIQNGNGVNIILNFYILNNPVIITETIPIKRIR